MNGWRIAHFACTDVQEKLIPGHQSDGLKHEITSRAQPERKRGLVVVATQCNDEIGVPLGEPGLRLQYGEVVW